LVRPDFVNARPTTTEAKMNITDGSIKSLNASFAERIAKMAWKTPIAMAVTPIGTTQKSTRWKPV